MSRNLLQGARLWRMRLQAHARIRMPRIKCVCGRQDHISPILSFTDTSSNATHISNRHARITVHPHTGTGISSRHLLQSVHCAQRNRPSRLDEFCQSSTLLIPASHTPRAVTLISRVRLVVESAMFRTICLCPSCVNSFAQFIRPLATPLRILFRSSALTKLSRYLGGIQFART